MMRVRMIDRGPSLPVLLKVAVVETAVSLLGLAWEVARWMRGK